VYSTSSRAITSLSPARKTKQCLMSVGSGANDTEPDPSGVIKTESPT
jgi:hypothetical protein